MGMYLAGNGDYDKYIIVIKYEKIKNSLKTSQFADIGVACL